MDARAPFHSAFDDDVEVPLTRPELPPPLRQRLRTWRTNLTYRLTEVPPWAHRPVALTVLCAVIAAATVAGAQWVLASWERQQAQNMVQSANDTPGLLVGIASGLAADVDRVALPAIEGGAVNVHVAGEVRLHGMVTLPAGSRAVDAIKAAGGATELADLDQVNLAQVVIDGDQVMVPARATPEAVGADPEVTAAPDTVAPSDPAAIPDQTDP